MLLASLLSFSFGTACFSAEDSISDIESKLLGEWQVGLTAITKPLPVKESFRTHLLGPIWQLNADHTVLAHFPCEVESYRKEVGLPALGSTRGNWYIDSNKIFHIRLDVPVKGNESGSIEKQGKIFFDEKPALYGTGTMSIKNDPEERGTILGRYDSSRENCK